MTMFSENLRLAREEKGLTKTAMAKAIGLSLPAYSNYESSIREPPIKNLKKIANVLNVSVDYLLGVNEADLNEYQQAKYFWKTAGCEIKETENEQIQIRSSSENMHKMDNNGVVTYLDISPVMSLADKKSFIIFTNEAIKTFTEQTNENKRNFCKHLIEKYQGPPF